MEAFDLDQFQDFISDRELADVKFAFNFLGGPDQRDAQAVYTLLVTLKARGDDAIAKLANRG